jgi:3-hydroxybutyryl-CoA dehydratase
MKSIHSGASKSTVGLSFQASYVGQTAEFSIQVTSKLIAEFGQMTGDLHPLHTDREYAKKAGFDNVIAHGLLISSLSSRLVGMQLPGEGAIVGSQSFDYILPVPAGIWLTFIGRVSVKDERFSKIDVTINVQNDAGERVARGKYIVFFRQNDILK